MHLESSKRQTQRQRLAPSAKFCNLSTHQKSLVLSFVGHESWSSCCSISKSCDIKRAFHTIDLSHDAFSNFNGENIVRLFCYFTTQRVVLTARQVINMAQACEAIPEIKIEQIKQNVGQITLTGQSSESRRDLKSSLNTLLKKLGDRHFTGLIDSINCYLTYKQLQETFDIEKFGGFLQKTFLGSSISFEKKFLFSSHEFINFVLTLCKKESVLPEQKFLFFEILFNCTETCQAGRKHLTENPKYAFLSTELATYVLTNTNLEPKQQLVFTSTLCFSLKNFILRFETFTSNNSDARELMGKLINLILIDGLDPISKEPLAELISTILCKSPSGQTVFLENRALITKMLDYFADFPFHQEVCTPLKQQIASVLKYLTKNNFNGADFISSNPKYVIFLTQMASTDPINSKIQAYVLSTFIQMTDIGTKGQANLFNENQTAFLVIEMLITITKNTGSNTLLMKGIALCISNLCQGLQAAQTCFFHENHKESVIDMLVDLINYSSLNAISIGYFIESFYDLIYCNQDVKDLLLKNSETKNKIFKALLKASNKRRLKCYEQEAVCRTIHELIRKAPKERNWFLEQNELAPFLRLSLSLS